MISSFFAKTKPINYVVLLGFIGVFYMTLQFFWNRDAFGAENIWITLLALAVLLLSVYVINELVQQNKVTELSSFAMLFFVVLTIMFPKSILDNNAVFANLFILLGIKKLLEVKEAKNAKHKIFDAVLLICLASLFFKWAVVYFAAVAFAINTFESKNLKIWLVFLCGIATFFTLVLMFSSIFGNQEFLWKHYNFLFVETELNTIFEKLNIKNAVFFTSIALFSVVDFIKLRKKGGGRLIMMRSMLLFFMVVLVVLLLENKDTTPILLSFFPAAVFITNFIETIKKKRLKELAANLFIITAFLVFFIENIG